MRYIALVSKRRYRRSLLRICRFPPSRRTESRHILTLENEFDIYSLVILPCEEKSRSSEDFGHMMRLKSIGSKIFNLLRRWSMLKLGY